MIKKTIYMLLLIIFLLPIFTCEDELYKKAPQFRTVTINGKNFFCNDRKEKPLIISFWALYCLPCFEELAELNEFHDKYGEKVEIAAICIDAETNSDITSFTMDNNYRFIVIFDKDNKIKEQFGITTIPYLLVLDKKNRIRYRQIGKKSDMSSRLLNILSEME